MEISNNYFIENRKLIKNIFQITLPAVFDLLAQTLIIALDMKMVSSLGPSAISSVGVGTAGMYALIPALIAVATGTTALLSRAYGADNKVDGKKAFAQSFFIAVPLGIILTLIFLLFSEQIINLVGNAKDMNLADAVLYQNMTVIGFPFLGVSIATFYAFRAMGENKIPMIGNTLALVLKVILNFLLVYLFKWGIFGAALSTTLTRLFSAIFSIYLVFWSKKNWISLELKDLKFDYFTSKRILKVGIPAAVEQLGLRIGMLIFEMMVISLGNLSYAAHKIALTAESISFNLGFAFSFAASALVGQELGKGSSQKALKNGYICTIIAMIVMSTFGLLFFIIPQFLVSLFTKDKDVIELATMALKIVSICQPFSGASMVLAGALRGAGDTKSVLLITYLGIFLIRIPITYLFLDVLNLGLAGAWIVMTIDLAIRSSLAFYVFRRGKWKYLQV
ncbi:MATE family efflux transporter [Fusobacterium pseudoperiodonticum]|uniref:Multidrug-efflux transporter n=1 Tax=Fusobacterium pseudoperiodonticum TaxID=2663009 RepID=A0A2G9EIQ7_9FUSO|nr:MATE family efflux transporter [Fusobacterium pseudoperiodonticum]ATV63697.1 MATE family efflux transporter [Fusobacterium pseudoperiodonticum]ATV65918.1 MATE family efflux transporter [Fusobacterium pseudoperiodonticum]ATV71684.1 MATE family efflux transporter [Fusobacterium pseudoperiodonticum]PIM80561.1 MATE family efflux transporter [Fusobacterium pseudoperiodonticum]